MTTAKRTVRRPAKPAPRKRSEPKKSSETTTQIAGANQGPSVRDAKQGKKSQAA